MTHSPRESGSLGDASDILDLYAGADGHEVGDALEPYSYDDDLNLDLDANAFELDDRTFGLEVAVDRAPEVFFRRSLPEALNEESIRSESIDPASDSKRICLKPKTSRVLLTIAFVACVATIIGIGVRYGMDKSKPASLSTLLPVSTTKLQTSRSKTTNSLPEPSNTDIVRTDFIHGILNDTSIASIVDKKNDRHVFFQEKTGIIRHVWYPSSSKQWTTGTNLVATSDAKNHTPLSAVLVEWSDEMIFLYYVNTTGFLRSKVLIDATWNHEDDIWTNVTRLPDLVTFPNSRHISALQILDDTANFTEYREPTANYNHTLLLFEDEDRSLVPFMGTVTISSEWKWTRLSFPADNWRHQYVGPFATSWSKLAGDMFLIVNLNLSNTGQSSYMFALDAKACCDNPQDLGLRSPPKLILDSDLVYVSLTYSSSSERSLLLQVNGTKLTGPGSNDDQTSIPVIQFPFKRLGVSSLPNSTTAYLYHQMDETTMVEEQYDAIREVWMKPSNITIET